MAAISGFLNKNLQQVPEGILNKFSTALSHRGKESYRYYDNYIGLSFGNFRNPMSVNGEVLTFENDRYVLLYSGLIYNIGEIIKTIKPQPSSKLSPASIAEILVNSIANSGLRQTLRLIDGNFAMMLFDKEKKELYLARDKWGVKPLYYTIQNETIYFASEIKALWSALPLKTDETRLLFFSLGVAETSEPASAFKDVHQIKVGAYLKFNKNQTEEVRYFRHDEYYDLNYFNELKNTGKDVLTANLKTLLEGAVNKQTLKDRSVGAMVSGGVDSSLLAYFASEYYDNLKLITADIKGPYSEVKDAEFLAQSINRPLLTGSYEPDMLLHKWAENTYYYEMPIIFHANAMPIDIAAKKAIENGIDLVMMGEVNDALFFGFPKIIFDRNYGFIKWPYQALLSLYGIVPAVKNYILNRQPNALASDLIPLVKNFEDETVHHEVLLKLQQFPEKDREDLFLPLLRFIKARANYIRNERMCMKYGINSIYPYFDDELIKFAFHLPVKYKIRKTWHFYNSRHPFVIDKFLYRHLAAKVLPRSLAFNPKKQTPMYGFSHLKIEKPFFYGGYLAEKLDLNKRQVNAMVDTMDPKLLAYLASVDIWGRIFERRQDYKVVTNDILKHISLSINR